MADILDEPLRNVIHYAFIAIGIFYIAYVLMQIISGIIYFGKFVWQKAKSYVIDPPKTPEWEQYWKEACRR